MTITLSWSYLTYLNNIWEGMNIWVFDIKSLIMMQAKQELKIFVLDFSAIKNFFINKINHNQSQKLCSQSISTNTLCTFYIHNLLSFKA